MALTTKQEECIVVVYQLITNIRLFLLLFTRLYLSMRRSRLRTRIRSDRQLRYSLRAKIPDQVKKMRELVGLSDTTCHDNLRMNRDTFDRLCFILENVGGLRPTRNVQVSEQVAIFLCVLGHHKKTVVLRTDFKRSSYTISIYFNNVLDAVLRLHSILLVTPQPVEEGCMNDRWKPFKGCLGALDGTYIEVRVSQIDKPRYRNRKGQISVNVLAVCDHNMNFTYVLSGWEGSAADSRILHDAVARQNELRVPNGQYYLVDGGYTNGNGFLAPYRRVRYHLQEYGHGRNAPQNHEEFFNMKHAKARNAIERAFGILKSRWGILRSPAYYPIKAQNRIILACCLLHNFIRTNVDVDPEEANVPKPDINGPIPPPPEFIDVVACSEDWTNWRDDLANDMYNDWINGH